MLFVCFHICDLFSFEDILYVYIYILYILFFFLTTLSFKHVELVCGALQWC